MSAGMKNFAEQYGIAINDPTLIRRYRLDVDARRDEATRQYMAHAEDAKRMKADGMDPALIAKYTGLTVDQISRL